MDATKTILCDCCKRELTVANGGYVGHQLGGWHSARCMLFGTYWCSECYGKRPTVRTEKPDWLPTEKPLYSRQDSARIAERLVDWLTRLQPLYDRSRWDYAVRTGWTPLTATTAAIKRIGTLTLETENGTITLNALTDGYALRFAKATQDEKSPEFLWKHFGKALTHLFRSLQSADAKRLRDIFRNS